MSGSAVPGCSRSRAQHRGGWKEFDMPLEIALVSVLAVVFVVRVALHLKHR
ncbi:hypothetical protein SAMN05216266_101707 [Amycolatopsis marina]|uniref:Uncharacterized protein n=1 Tax=Amycolatopsis marina TaxID=490629 RepID=A0A1I0W5K8_9PSEU|nr:hypothetical protein SAMN05216266_101707 [Amycolatopsis marina]